MKSSIDKLRSEVYKLRSEVYKLRSEVYKLRSEVRRPSITQLLAQVLKFYHIFITAQEIVQAGEFLLYTKILKYKGGLLVAVQMDVKLNCLVIVDDKTMFDFDRFKSQCRKQNPKSIMVPLSQVLLHWMAESQCVLEEVKEYGCTYYALSESEFEELAFWVHMNNNNRS